MFVVSWLMILLIVRYKIEISYFISFITLYVFNKKNKTVLKISFIKTTIIEYLGRGSLY